MSVVFFTLPGNPRSVQMLEIISTLRMQGCAPGFEVVCSTSAPTVPGTGVGLFDHSLSLSQARPSARHLGMYAPRLLKDRLGEEILLSQGWPQWVQGLPYAVAVGEAAVGDEVVQNRAHFLLHTFTQGAAVNARKPDRLPWGQPVQTIRNPMCRFDWRLRRAGSRTVLMGSC
mgnify:CR=1 FL=1